jgi:hypothetical protein
MKISSALLSDISEGLEEVQNTLNGRFGTESVVLVFTIEDNDQKYKVTATLANFGDWDLEIVETSPSVSGGSVTLPTPVRRRTKKEA